MVIQDFDKGKEFYFKISVVSVDSFNKGSDKIGFMFLRGLSTSFMEKWLQGHRTRAGEPSGGGGSGAGEKPSLGQTREVVLIGL